MLYIPSISGLLYAEGAVRCTYNPVVILRKDETTGSSW